MKAAAAGHPRLYFNSAELGRLRASRTAGRHAAIWANMATDAEHFAAEAGRTDWIEPLAPDPKYENLYDRFWAIMSDAAIVEHLAFTAAFCGEDKFAGAASARLLAACQRWYQEVCLPPDYGTAYATTRILKAIAVGYDMLYAVLSEDERTTVSSLLATGARRMAAGWFSRPDVRGPVGVKPSLHSPHHSSVEWTAFGVVALCLLGEVPEAAEWVNATTRHFTAHLLPSALAADGSHPEGNEFWASTVSSQLQYLDPLRRVTGQDLLAAAVRSISASFAIAAFRPCRELSSQGEPLYGDSTCVSAVLFALARELRDPALQWLAMQEPTTGRTEVTPSRTPRRGERFRIAPGGYAYAWCDPELRPSPPAPTAWEFRLAQETYLRSGWGPDDVLVAVRAGKVSVYFGGRTVFTDLTPVRLVDLEASLRAGTGIYAFDPPDLVCRASGAGQDGRLLWARCQDDAGAPVARIELDAATQTVVIDRTDGHRRRCAYSPSAHHPGAGARLRITRGWIEATKSNGHREPAQRPGYDLLDVEETDVRWYETMEVSPADGRITFTIGLVGRTGYLWPCSQRFSDVT